MPESIYYINKFMLSGQTLDWQYIDEMPYPDYQLFIIMSNAYGNKMKAEQGSGGSGSFKDAGAIGVEGDLELD